MSNVTLLQYSDTGESGETYDIDVQTLPWRKICDVAASSDLSKAWTRKCHDSESGEAYEAEVESLSEEAGDPPPVPVDRDDRTGSRM